MRFYQGLCEAFDRTPIIDSHEHLPKESARLRQQVDFTTLFAHYTRDDFYATGMSLEELALMQSPDTDLERKWRLFSAYYPMARDTSMCARRASRWRSSTAAAILQAFPNVRFVLLHCGIPWTDQAAILAKYFANVYIDMAWLHIVSHDIAVKGLKRWMDLLPMNKIGGDYLIVEKVYGHLCIARENICRALTEKEDEIGMSRQRAELWLRRRVHDNVEAVYFSERFR